ncbi:Peroxisomal membrane signal receptor PTS1 [Paramarasmius palmivorus]|uniref:Peroxisomal membrane signal receptor PTS1 n=1 Tax=Paramarasmius palmivorus TaxID=297713 RepID=A0AAW0CA94_9AGAR
MSFQSLISGSECAAPANPLNQVLKHTEGDRSLQQDRIAGPSTSRLQHLPGTSSSAATSQDLALARQFFETNNGGRTFAMPPELAREMSSFQPQINDAWVVEQQQQMRAFQANQAQTQWAAEFGNTPALQKPTTPITSECEHGAIAFCHSSQSSLQAAQHQVPIYRSNFQTGFPLRGMYGGLPMMQNFNGELLDKGKGKNREADFEAAFDQYAASLTPVEKEQSRIVELNDSVTNIEEAMKSASLNEGELGTDFRKVWDHLQKSEIPPPKEDLAKWEAEFNQLMNAQRDELDYDYGSVMQEAWENGQKGITETVPGDKPLQFGEDGLPVLEPYTFEPENKYLDPSTSSSSMLAQAKALLEQNGSLSEAALLLEAAIQKGELGEGGYEAWILLGETRNMDEREQLGIRALNEGVRRAEAVDSKGAGMMSLAISFTNEGLDRASHIMLLRWLRARYPDVHVPEETTQAIAKNAAWDTHTRIIDLFLNLARQQHGQGIVDADVQIALGVLFYTNADFDRAKDCFEAALSVRPADYLLWNRFGSSLSNGNKPEEALGAYKEALQLRPTYTRAIYNVGVACLNIGADKEAAEHFLSALALQQSTAGETSDQLWFTLRRALLGMGRLDLADHAKREAKSNLELFRAEGFDF